MKCLSLVLALVAFVSITAAAEVRSFDVGLNFPNIFEESESVTLVSQIGDGPIRTEGPFKVADLPHRTHAAEGSEAFAALEIRRTYTEAEMAAGVKAKLVNGSGRSIQSLGLMVYRVPPPPK